MAHKTEFLYMSEPDTIAAGVLDARKCIDNAEEVFTLLAKGDYLMGGNNHNNHGMYIVFPKESEFPICPSPAPTAASSQCRLTSAADSISAARNGTVRMPQTRRRACLAAF